MATPMILELLNNLKARVATNETNIATNAADIATNRADFDTHAANDTRHWTTADRQNFDRVVHFKGYFTTKAKLEESYPTGELGDYAIVGATDTVWAWDDTTSSWLNTTEQGIVISVNGRTGEVILTKTDVGLSNVDNTSDVDKPISTAQQTAFDAKADRKTITSSEVDSVSLRAGIYYLNLEKTILEYTDDKWTVIVGENNGKTVDQLWITATGDGTENCHIFVRRLINDGGSERWSDFQEIMTNIDFADLKADVDLKAYSSDVYTKDEIDNQQEAQDDLIQQNADSISNLAMEFDYTEGEGASVSIESVLENCLMNIKFGGNCVQLTTTGKNILNPSFPTTYTMNGVTFTSVYDNGKLQYIEVNGTASDTAYMSTTEVVYPNGTYKLTGCPSGGAEDTYKLILFRLFDYYGVGEDLGEGAIVTTNDNYSYGVRVRIASGFTANGLRFYPMLRLSSITDDTYEPYTGEVVSPNPDYPQDIKVATGENTIKIESQNFYNEDDVILGYALNVDGTGGNSNYTDTTGFMKVEANITYEFSYDYDALSVSTGRAYCFYNNEKNHISGGMYDVTSKETTITPSQSGYIKISYDKNITDVHFKRLKNKQLNLGDIELCKIGDYQDYIYKENGVWYLHKVINKYQLSGNVHMRDMTVQQGRNIFAIVDIVQDYDYVDERTLGAICTHFRSIPVANRYQDNTIFINSIKDLIITSNSFESNAELQTFLNNNNVILYYALATPTDTEITDETLIEQLDVIISEKTVLGTNTISSTCQPENAPILFKISVPNTTVAELQLEVNMKSNKGGGGSGGGAVNSVNNKTGDVILTKTDIGLGNVDNIADANKNVKSAQSATNDDLGNKISETYVKKSGDTMTGDLTLDKGKINLTTNSALSYDKNKGIIYFYIDDTVVATLNSDGIFNANKLTENVGGFDAADGGKGSGGSLPVGTVVIYPSQTVPDGWMLCDGRAISRADYEDLFNILGTTYGSGNGSTTFNLPDFKQRTPVGYDANSDIASILGLKDGEKEHTLTVAEIPSNTVSGVDGVYIEDTSTNYTQLTGTADAHNNMQPYIVQNFIIKVTADAQGSGTSDITILNSHSDSVYDVYSANYVNQAIETAAGFIFEWDGESSTTNTDNIALWQEIYDKQKEKTCLILVGKATQNTQFFVVQSGYLTNNTGDSAVKTLLGVYYASTYSSNASYSQKGYAQIQVNLTINASEKVTRVGAMTTPSNLWKFLEIDVNYTTPYTPQYNGSPATKKYVDDAIKALKEELAAGITTEELTTEAIIMENTPQLYTDDYKTNNPSKFS